MYFEKAIERINNINWSRLNLRGGDDDKNLGGKYLHRLAVFVRDHSASHKNFIPNIATELGDEESIDIADYCSIEAQEALKDRSFPSYFTMCYLQLAKYADQNPDAYQYMQVYDPMIQMLEEGFIYGYREGGLMIYGGAFYPLGGWYERFLNINPE